MGSSVRNLFQNWLLILVPPSLLCVGTSLLPLTLPAYKRLQPGGKTGASGTERSPEDDQDPQEAKTLIGQEVVG